MTGSARRPTCFLSYARADDEPFVERLRDVLRSAPYHVDVWWDRVAMQSRGVSFLQEIDEAVRAVDRVVLVCGPAAAVSPYVQHELEMARRACTVVVPVLRTGASEHVPEWLVAHHRFDLREDDPRQLAGLGRSVSRPPDPIAPVAAGLPPVPGTTLASNAAREVVRLLLPALVSGDRPAGDASGVRLAGLPGIGKTVTAGLVARDCAIRRSYAGGIHFIRVGSHAGAQAVVNDLRRSLGVQPGPGETNAEAVASLAEALADTRRLVVLDDVWRSEQLRDVWTALAGGAHRLLFTSRRGDLGADLAVSGVELPLPGTAEVTAFLTRRLGVAEADLPPAAALVVERCGRLPLALALCVAQVARGVSWVDLAAGLEAADPQVLSGEVSGYEHHGARAAMQVSVDRLATSHPQLADRYRQLALFRAGRPIPAHVIERLWGASGEVDRRTVRRQLAELAAWSLLVRDPATDDVVLHDLHRHYLRPSADETALARRLLDAYGADPVALLAAAGGDAWLRGELMSLVGAAERPGDADALFDLTGSDGGHAWADLRGRWGELDGLWADLEAWTAIGGTPREQLRRSVRSTLVRCSIRASSWRVPPRLLATAARAGVWTVEQALDVARRNPNADQHVPARLALLEHLTPGRRTAVLQEALDEVPALTDVRKVMDRLRAVLTWGPTAGVGVTACLDALAATPASRLAPEVFELLAGHLDEHRERAEALARRSPAPLVAAAALTRADPPDEARQRVWRLCSETDLVASSRIVAAAARPELPDLTELADELARWAIRDDRATAERADALQALLPVVSDSCLDDLVDRAQAHGGLASMTMLSPLELYRRLRRRRTAPGDLAGLRQAGRQLDPSYLGVGLLARAAAAEPAAHADDLAEAVEGLERELSPDGLADVSDDLALLWPRLPERLRIRLLAAAVDVYVVDSRAAALASLLPLLPGPQRRSVLTGELTRLANVASGLALDRAFDMLADHLETDQVEFALAVATAARDNGFERAGLKALVDVLAPAVQPRAVAWAVSGAVGRLRQEGFAHEADLVDLLETLAELGIAVPAKAEGTAISDVVAGLTRADLRARAFGALAAGREDLWPRAETALENVETERLRLLVLSGWPRFASGERRARYVADALQLLTTVDNLDQAAAIRALIPFADLTAQADRLIAEEFADRRPRLLPSVADALSLPTVTTVARWNHDSLDTQSAAAVARRLLDLGALAEAWTLIDRLEGFTRQAALEACASDLDADRVRAELDRNPASATRRALLARLARLGHVEEALAGVAGLTGVEHLHILAVIADAIPGERGPRLVAPRLDLLRDAGPDPLARCTRALVPVLLRLAGEERLDACRRLLDLLSGWPRLQALQAVYNTAPLIAAAGGPDAATDTFDALLDVMRWWPSLARLPTVS